MTQGELLQAVRQHTHDLVVLEEQVKMLTKELYEMKEVLKSPIRREIYATREKHKQEGHERKHPSRDGGG